MPNITGPIKGLVENIAGSVSNLITQITNSSTDSGVPKNPRTSEVLSVLDQGNWNKLVFPYTFDVLTEDGASVDEFTAFSLPIAPQSIKQSEEFAINITPTQGGTTVSHSGNRYKTLTIAGTTGIAPFRGGGGALSSTGEGIFQPSNLKYRSGYEVFIRLRNWFRAYYEFKKNDPEQARKVRLVFKNFKDGEFLIVELLKFDMTRQAPKSFLYDYTLDFRVLSHFTFKPLESGLIFDTVIGSALAKIEQARGIFLRSQDILRQVEATYIVNVLEGLRVIGLSAKAFEGIETTAADISSRNLSTTIPKGSLFGIIKFVQDEQASVAIGASVDPRIRAIVLPEDINQAVNNLGPSLITSFGEGLQALPTSIFPEETLQALEDEQALSLQLPRSYYEKLIIDLTRIKQNMEDFLNLGSIQYDLLFNRTKTLAPNDTIDEIQAIEILNGFNESIIAIQLILSVNDLFKSTFEERIKDMLQRFDDQIDLRSSVASKEITVNNGDTLERIALRELGDAQRWGEIVELNDLKFPYLVDDATSTLRNVKKTGETLLVPAPLINGFSQVPEGKENRNTVNLNELEKSLGTDLRIDANFDLVLTPSGDIDLISGANNMAQQIILKLSYTKGDLLNYPQVGAGVIIGDKFPPLNQIKESITNSLLADNRIDSLEDLSLIRNNSELMLSFVVKIKQIDIPIPITIKVN